MTKNKMKNKSILKLIFTIPIIGILLMSAEISKNESYNMEDYIKDDIKHSVTITKDFTDEDFEALKTKLSKKGITIKFKGIKRNDDGEITDISIIASSKNSKVKSSTSGDAPIEPIVITYDKNNISINSGTDVTVVGKYKHNDSRKARYKVSSKGNSNVYVYTTVDSDDDVEEIIIKKSGKGNIAKVLKKHAVGTVTFDEIDDESIILKDGNTIEVIIDDIDIDTDVEVEDDIIIIKNNASVWTSNSDSSIKIKTIGGKNKSKYILLSNDNGKDPLIMIDGEKASKDDFEKLDTDIIEEIDVLKGDKAIETYGKDAEGGVILIKTKKQ